MKASHAVSKRFQDVILSHEASLAGHTPRSQVHHTVDAVSRKRDRMEGAAHRRSFCSQPPNDNSYIGGGSATSASVAMISGMNLNPQERATPCSLIIQQDGEATSTSTKCSDTETDLGSDHLLPHSQQEAVDKIISSATCKAITTISTLCDEVHELELVGKRKLLGQLLLFGHDLQEGNFNNSRDFGRDRTSTQTTNVLDQNNHERDMELTRRIGKFMKVLQSTMNYTLRCHRLLRNIICQFGACCVCPISMWNHREQLYGHEDDASSNESSVDKSTDDSTSTINSTTLFGNINEHTSTSMKDSKQYILKPIGVAIAKILEMLIVIDQVIASNHELQEAWELYKTIVMDRTEGLSQQDNENEATMMQLERMLMQIDFTLISSRSFLVAIEQNFDPHGLYYTFTKTESTLASTTLHDEMKYMVSTLFDECCSRINTEQEMNERSRTIGVYGMYCLYRRLIPSHITPDEKLHRALCTRLPSICPIIPMFGDLVFIPTDFIARYAHLEGYTSSGSRMAILIQGNSPNTSSQSQAKQLLVKRDKLFSSKTSTLYSDALSWLVRVDSDLAPSVETNDVIIDHEDKHYTQSSPTQDIQFKTLLIFKGIAIGRTATILLKDYLSYHKHLRSSIPAQHLSSINKLCFVSKSIEKALRVRCRSSIMAIHRAAVKMIAASIFSRFDTLRSFVDQHGALTDRVQTFAETINMSRITTALSVLESLLKGSSTFSPGRRYAIEVAIKACSCTQGRGYFGKDKVEDCESLLQQLCLLSDMDEFMQQACDCSFLYFHKEVLPQLVKNIYESNQVSELPRFQLLMTAFSDAKVSLLMSPLDEHYRKYMISNVLYKEIVLPLCQDIENALRLQVYTRNMDEMKVINPKETKIHNVMPYLNLPSLQICGIQIDIKKCCQRHLELQFYNDSTVGLNDSQTYSQMRVLAEEAFGLSILSNHLPVGSIEQSVDLQEVVNDMDAFTTSFHYNINQENFIERRRKGNCKYLATIGIESISFSLRRHGFGIINSATVSMYQFLSKSFQTLSQLLRDDYFRSALSKEKRLFDQEAITEYKTYPYERAAAFSKEVAKLGIEQGVSFLDQCKGIITAMGNAIGLSRLIKTGKLYCLHQGFQFIPSRFDGDYDRRSYIDESRITQARGNKAIHVSVEHFNSLLDSSFDKDDFSQILYKLFRTAIASSDHTHLDCFFLLFPALCLSWLDSSLRGKEMAKKHPSITPYDAFYTDDGFAVGVSFLLSVLEQHQKMDGMKWFESYKSKITMEKREILECIQKEEMKLQSFRDQDSSSVFKISSRDKKEDESSRIAETDLTRLKVTAKRLDMRMQEIEMLSYSLQGARIYFED